MLLSIFDFSVIIIIPTFGLEGHRSRWRCAGSRPIRLIYQDRNLAVYMLPGWQYMCCICTIYCQVGSQYTVRSRGLRCSCRLCRHASPLSHRSIVWCSGFRVQGLGYRFWVEGTGFGFSCPPCGGGGTGYEPLLGGATGYEPFESSVETALRRLPTDEVDIYCQDR